MKHFFTTTTCMTAILLTACDGRTNSGDVRPNLPPVTDLNSEYVILDQYIIVFDQNTSDEALKDAREKISDMGGEIIHSYDAALKGFNVKISKQNLESLRGLKGIDYIEADKVGSFDTVQINPPTGLDRVSERLLPLDNRYTYDGATGSGVNAYVIDSGMRITHTDFGSRATDAFTVQAGDFSDCYNHGTHVAGTIGGNQSGIAKNVNLFNVRVGTNPGCGANAGTIIAGVYWVTANRILPAVANLSVGVPASTALDTSVNNLVNSGVVAIVAAGNNNGADACFLSPARVPPAITIGSIDPQTDARSGFSNIGTCIDMFAPGSNIVSATNISDTSFGPNSGTSMAAPHAAGIAARILETNPAQTPAQVQAAMTFANNVSTTVAWPGVSNRGAGSPNESLHYGSRNNGFSDGDPHITTVNGVRYDFQAAGEFTILREANGMEIQARQTAVSTQVPVNNNQTGLKTCVSLNTAIATKVGNQRVTYQPRASGTGSQNAMELRIDGNLINLSTTPVPFTEGGFFKKVATGEGIEIEYPDGTSMIVTSRWWNSQNLPYINLSVYNTMAKAGIMGEIQNGAWLPRLPDGSSLGPKPTNASQRYQKVYQEFTNAWRVSNSSSLFDYETGESTSDFTIADWPPLGPSCEIPSAPITPVKPIREDEARKICAGIKTKHRLLNCVADVAATGEKDFALAYLQSEKIEAGATKVRIVTKKEFGKEKDSLIAFVNLLNQQFENRIKGTVQFWIDKEPFGKPIRLEGNGRAQVSISLEELNGRRLKASFVPVKDSLFLPSESLELELDLEKQK